jgi:hypothetical protein
MHDHADDRWSESIDDEWRQMAYCPDCGHDWEYHSTTAGVAVAVGLGVDWAPCLASDPDWWGGVCGCMRTWVPR